MSYRQVKALDCCFADDVYSSTGLRGPQNIGRQDIETEKGCRTATNFLAWQRPGAGSLHGRQGAH